MDAVVDIITSEDESYEPEERLDVTVDIKEEQ